MSDLARRDTLSIGGFTYRKSEDIDADNAPKIEKTLAAAKVGTLPTRTDNTSGTLTMNSGHGFITGDIIDLYWSGGSRRNVTVGTVATNSVPISGGAGDNLPVATTAITAMVQSVETYAITGANVTALAVYGAAKSTIVFQQSDKTEIKGYVLAAGASDFWTTGSGLTNPVTGQTIGKIAMTHGDSSGSKKVRCHILWN